MMKVVVEQARKRHIARIVDFQIAMAQETEEVDLDRETATKGVSAVFDDLSKGQYLVALENQQLIGTTLLTPEWSDWRNGYVYWIQSVYVLPEYRGKRVFATIYEHIKRLVMQHESLIGLRLYVDKTNEKAQKVYEKLGMNGEHYKLFEWMK
ncbi:MAG: GNAT family N-acetyltransferase [Bacteroidales bacterium]|nr:GNAT family N-acetyltransferase [Bacteroidales bacterium]